MEFVFKGAKPFCIFVRHNNVNYQKQKKYYACGYSYKILSFRVEEAKIEAKRSKLSICNQKYSVVSKST